MTLPRNITTHRLTISGAVQGVGFRPFVFREATHRHLDGWVRNTSSGVEILVSGVPSSVEEFIQAVQTSAPLPAKIIHLDVAPADDMQPGKGFHILSSNTEGQPFATILPDQATCPECLREIRDPGNRRFRYPFTNCTSCGPRYSIVNRLPYDRENTTMRIFKQCPECRHEYHDPADRRFHAQPNACPVCGPHLALWDRHGRGVAEKNDALLEAAQCLRQGGIVAVKGIGGFHLMADATQDQAVRLLRQRKHREEKPLAVMVPDLAAASSYAVISDTEQKWLNSPVAPIVLLKKKNGLLSSAIAPGNACLGIFLPYSPLHHLLMDEMKTALIATSGNLSDEPICIDEYDALERLGEIADLFLVHNRPIAHPVDDSVIRIVLDRALILRSARGLAPITLDFDEDHHSPAILAVGPHMKATVALSLGSSMIVSPHIGDLETVPAWQAYERNVETLESLYGVSPSVMACDLHPHYASTRFAERRTATPHYVQHHHTHILAVMAEHRLSGPVLGFAFDGTGYGDDGTIWGGEVLRIDRKGFQRVGHLRTFSLPGGDSAAREPRRSALGILHELGLPNSSDAFTPAEYAILTRAMNKRINTVRTSSAGRLFDAVASLLDVCRISSYEGQAAMQLQTRAEEISHDGSSYPWADGLDWGPVILGLLADRDAGVDTSVIAARFHQSIVNMIAATAKKHPDIPIVLGGGCFQNAWLLDHTVGLLRAYGREVYWPNVLPPNDGAVSVGQAMASRWRLSL